MVTETPARAGRSSAGRIVPLFRPYRLQVAAVIVLIVGKHSGPLASGERVGLITFRFW